MRPSIQCFIHFIRYKGKIRSISMSVCFLNFFSYLRMVLIFVIFLRMVLIFVISQNGSSICIFSRMVLNLVFSNVSSEWFLYLLLSQNGSYICYLSQNGSYICYLSQNVVLIFVIFLRMFMPPDPDQSL